jgi:hypothetical protein
MQTPIWVWEEKIHRYANERSALRSGNIDHSFESIISPVSLFPYHSAYRNPEINATIQTVSVETNDKTSPPFTQDISKLSNENPAQRVLFSPKKRPSGTKDHEMLEKAKPLL